MASKWVVSTSWVALPRWSEHDLDCHESQDAVRRVPRLGLDELAEYTAPEAATHFTLCCTGQTVVLGGLAPGLAYAVFLAPQL
jgi:hypothetical protein